MSTENLFLSFVRHVQAVCNQFSREHNFKGEAVTYTEGPIYWRVVRGTSVYGFVRKRDGAILRAASYKAPTKIVVGFLHDYRDSLLGGYGLAHVGHYHSYRPSQYPPRDAKNVPTFLKLEGVPALDDWGVLDDFLQDQGREEDRRKIQELYGPYFIVKVMGS